MLEKYCEKQGWEVVAVYQDDGFTGLNMERPDLQRMLRAIERRQINLVITKDLSRLGRNYLQTGHLIEDFFPRNGVRSVSYTHLDVYKRQLYGGRCTFRADRSDSQENGDVCPAHGQSSRYLLFLSLIHISSCRREAFFMSRSRRSIHSFL